MVAVTSQEEAAKIVPVTLEPTPAGQWRWAGTKTLLFDPDPRFPMSTDYTVTVPQGIESATGMALEAGKTWTFTTPTLQMVQRLPMNGPHDLNPLIFVSFDQKIDADVIRGKGEPLFIESEKRESA